MENKVILKFKEDIIALAGFEYGEQTFEQQIKGKIDYDKDFYIEFPDNIRIVASSFVQGLFFNIVKEIGFASTDERVRIISKNERLCKKIKEKLI
jgi:hypothetical protein